MCYQSLHQDAQWLIEIRLSSGTWSSTVGKAKVLHLHTTLASPDCKNVREWIPRLWVSSAFLNPCWQVLIFPQPCNSPSFFNIFPSQVGAVLILRFRKTFPDVMLELRNSRTAAEKMSPMEWPPLLSGLLSFTFQQHLWGFPAVFLDFAFQWHRPVFFSRVKGSLPSQMEGLLLSFASLQLWLHSGVRRWYQDPAVGATCGQAVSIKDEKRLAQSSSIVPQVTPHPS